MSYGKSTQDNKWKLKSDNIKQVLCHKNIETNENSNSVGGNVN